MIRLLQKLRFISLYLTYPKNLFRAEQTLQCKRDPKSPIILFFPDEGDYQTANQEHLTSFNWENALYFKPFREDIRDDRPTDADRGTNCFEAGPYITEQRAQKGHNADLTAPVEHTTPYITLRFPLKRSRRSPETLLPSGHFSGCEYRRSCAVIRCLVTGCT